MKAPMSALHARVALFVLILQNLHRDVQLEHGVQEEKQCPVSYVLLDFSVQVQVHHQMCAHLEHTLQQETQLVSHAQQVCLVLILAMHQWLVMMGNTVLKVTQYATFVLLDITVVILANQLVSAVRATIH